MKEVQKELIRIQSELKAHKGQRNTFGKYNYRSCEDICEAYKKVKQETTLTLSDEMVAVGDRIYVKATATFTAVNDCIQVTAFAREAEQKKGMDSSQVTGATSSYARKYALNGLFLIDDTKDADTDAYTKQNKGASQQASKPASKSVNAPAPKPQDDSPMEGDDYMSQMYDKAWDRFNEMKETKLNEEQRQWCLDELNKKHYKAVLDQLKAMES